MKKTMLTAALAAMTATFAVAADNTGIPVLQYNSFSGLEAGSSLLSGATVNAENGNLVVSKTSGNYENRPTINLTSYNLSLASGLTLSFTASGWETANSILVAFAGSGNSGADNNHLFAVAASGTSPDFMFSASSGNVADVVTPASDTLDFEKSTFFTLTTQLGTINEEEHCIFTLYKNGELLAQSYALTDSKNAYDPETAAAADITRLTLGGWAGTSANNATGLTVENIALYNYAMTGDNVKYLYQTSIPEPATATLSLLALAGLAARRRRK